MAIHECRDCREDFPGREMRDWEERVVIGGQRAETSRELADGRIVYAERGSERFQIERFLLCADCFAKREAAAAKAAEAAEAAARAGAREALSPLAFTGFESRRRRTSVLALSFCVLAAMLLVGWFFWRAPPPVESIEDLPPRPRLVQAAPAEVTPSPLPPVRPVEVKAHTTISPPAAPLEAPAIRGEEPAKPYPSATLAVGAALESGAVARWSSFASSGEVHPLPRPSQEGAPCRAYYVIADGRSSAKSEVCQGEDGAWRPRSPR